MERKEAIELYIFALDINTRKGDILNYIEDEVGGIDILSLEDWKCNPEGKSYEEYLNIKRKDGGK